jgi:hypothetical protein
LAALNDKSVDTDTILLRVPLLSDDIDYISHKDYAQLGEAVHKVIRYDIYFIIKNIKSNYKSAKSYTYLLNKALVLDFIF